MIRRVNELRRYSFKLINAPTETPLVAAALWFAAQTKLVWERDYRRDIRLALETGAPALPALSTANIRELMRPALPLAQPTLAEAALSVVGVWQRLTRKWAI